MTLFKSHKSQQFEQLLTPHLSRLYSLAFQLTTNRNDAEDLVHDLVVKVRKQKKPLDKIEYLGAWLSKVMYRLHLDQQRANSRNPLYMSKESLDSESNEIPLDQLESYALSPESYVDQARFLKALECAVSQLPEEQRVLVVMRDIEGYNMEEIQQILELPMGTLKSRLHRARSKIIKNLNKTGTDQSRLSLIVV